MKKEFSISAITPQVYVSGWPRKKNAQMVKDMNFDLILHLLWQPTDKILRDSDVNLHRIVMIDSPITPLPMSRLKKGVDIALPILNDGGKVLVYCKQGVHRSMAMASCILIAQGYTLEETQSMINKNRPVAKPHTPYIKARIKKYRDNWKEHHGKKR